MDKLLMNLLDGIFNGDRLNSADVTQALQQLSQGSVTEAPTPTN